MAQQRETRTSITNMFILHRLSQKPSSGYDLINYINNITQGSWKPGSASIYPVLRRLEKAGLIKTVETGSRKVYTIKELGLERLSKLKEDFNRYSTERRHRIKGMMLFIVDPKFLAKMLAETIEMQPEAWERILSSKDITSKEKLFLLQEHKLLLEKHLDWVNSRIKMLQESGE